MMRASGRAIAASVALHPPRLLSSLFQRVLFSTASSPTTCSTLCPVDLDPPTTSADVLRRWGCTDADISKLMLRAPSLRRANVPQLESKLSILRDLGITGPDLVKVVHCRPRFLRSRINNDLHERLSYFTSFFGSPQVLRRAIIRNPSFLTYDFHRQILPSIALYEQVGLSKSDLICMLISRPTMIPRSSFEDEKLDYIRKTCVPQNSKMYKYVVTLIAISRLDTIREKVANLEKFGFSEEEVLGLFGRSPLMMTLSVDKVQRNMTFIVGTIKLPAKVVLDHPFLLHCNLETCLKPRILLAAKIQDMGLSPQIKGPTIFKALRMTEKRFLNAFVSCHPVEFAQELNQYYRTVKGVKRLAEASKKNMTRGFPF